MAHGFPKLIGLSAVDQFARKADDDYSVQI